MATQDGSSNPKTALITGAAQGLGFETAAALLRRGDNVVVFDLDRDAGEAAVAELSSVSDDVECAFAQGSVIAAAEVESAFDVAEERFGTVDYLVNNAGVYRPLALIEDLDEADWDTIVDVNLKGTFLCSRAFYRRLRDDDAERAIVNVSSLNSEAPSESVSAYSAAKAGIRQLTQVCALEFAPRRVRVNAVSPGSVRPANFEAEGHQDEPMVREWLARTPLGRVGQFEDVALVTAFLLSSQARWVTGVTIPVDGGQHMRGLQNYWQTANEDKAYMASRQHVDLDAEKND